MAHRIDTVSGTSAVILFHRDLRLVDHNALEVAQTYGKVLPLFVFTPEQVTTKNVLRSTNSIQCMIQSLRELQEEIANQHGKLYVGYGKTLDILKQLYRNVPFTALVETADYTPYAKQRTKELSEWCATQGIEYNSVEDSYLLPPGTIRNGAGKTFQKFTPFYETARKKQIPLPKSAGKISFVKLGGKQKRTRKRNSWEVSLDAMEERFIPNPNPEIAVKGGRSEALQLLQQIPADYAKTHDIPSVPTSFLSAHNHYGTVSIREVYHAAKGNEAFRRQLWWRDFYGNIMADFETLYGVGPYEFQKDRWEKPLSAEKQQWLEQWKTGDTGVRLVDAGMKQLLRTGWMHNRLRLVVASWLTKDKHIHWRHGERFFAQHLVDYDATQNMMNWIWVASELPFASAPFRKVSAKGTAEKFDPDEEYVKTWL